MDLAAVRLSTSSDDELDFLVTTLGKSRSVELTDHDHHKRITTLHHVRHVREELLDELARF